MGQHNPELAYIYGIGRWTIANMLHRYYTIIGCRYEANANIGNRNPILIQCGFTRESQCQYRQRPMLNMLNQRYIHVVWEGALGQNIKCKVFMYSITSHGESFSFL